MKTRLTIFALMAVLTSQGQGSLEVNHLADLALKCMQQEYPNKLNQVLGDSTALKGPRVLHPAFYGCFDWHSAVHGHWMLVKLMKAYPELPQTGEVRRKLSENLTAENIKGEIAYFQDKDNRLFERTYGWAWLLKLQEELITWEDEEAKKWATNLQPLTDLIVDRYLEFLPKLTYPIRTGEHPNTAFGLSFAWDYALAAEHDELKQLIAKRAMDWYGNDENGPVNWEPNGFDFLSPCLEEARIMSRVITDKNEYQQWLESYLSDLLDTRADFPFTIAEVSDRTDGKIVHLDGLNLSRAWCLLEIMHKLEDKTLKERLGMAAEEHFKASGPQILSGSYEGEHWLASFAVYALTRK